MDSKTFSIYAAGVEKRRGEGLGCSIMADIPLPRGGRRVVRIGWISADPKSYAAWCETNKGLRDIGLLGVTPCRDRAVKAAVEQTFAAARERLDGMLRPARDQALCNIGLFDDDTRNQGDMFQ